MSYRDHEGNMSHPFTPYLFLGNFNPATVANDPFITDPFVFSAMTFIILNRSEDPFAE